VNYARYLNCRNDINFATHWGFKPFIKGVDLFEFLKHGLYQINPFTPAMSVGFIFSRTLKGQQGELFCCPVHLLLYL